MCSATYPNSTCAVAHALASSGERNRGTGQNARSGCGKARGTFVNASRYLETLNPEWHQAHEFEGYLTAPVAKPSSGAVRCTNF